MSVAQTPGYRFCDLSIEEQEIISAMKQSQICLESWDLCESDRQYHRNMISRCASELLKLSRQNSSN